MIWEPTIVQPELTAGDALALRRLRAPRAARSSDGAGKPIVAHRPVVIVGRRAATRSPTCSS